MYRIGLSFVFLLRGYAIQVHRASRSNCDLPVYDLQTWMKEHGNVAPDHAAVFSADEETKSWGTFSIQDEKEFVQEYGTYIVEALPEFAQAGGHLAFLNVPVYGYPWESVQNLSTHWHKDKRYYNDFACESDLCHAVKNRGGDGVGFDTPKLFKGEAHSTNFLIGGNGSGLPFHRHAQTWQGLVLGKKAWQILPNDYMDSAMETLTGPYTYPVRGWQDEARSLALGERPLYCEQNPGEIVWIPEWWWHATSNIGGFNLASGGKPKDWLELQEGPSEALLKQKAPFDAVRQRPQEMLTFNFIERIQKMQDGLTEAQTRATTIENFDELDLPLNLLRQKAETEIKAAASDDLPMANTAAFAHCVVAGRLKKIRTEMSVSDENAQKLLEHEEKLEDIARSLDQGVYFRQCIHMVPMVPSQLFSLDAHIGHFSPRPQNHRT